MCILVKSNILTITPLLNISETKSLVVLMITDYDRLLLAFSIRTCYFCDQKFQYSPEKSKSKKLFGIQKHPQFASKPPFPVLFPIPSLHYIP